MNEEQTNKLNANTPSLRFVGAEPTGAISVRQREMPASLAQATLSSARLLASPPLHSFPGRGGIRVLLCIWKLPLESSRPELM